MSEKCPYCGGDFENTKALGSHIHYMHNNIYVQKDRSGTEKEQFLHLLNGCLSDRDLRKPKNVDKIEQAIVEIPEGISPMLDKYRGAFKCAINKEKLVNRFMEQFGSLFDKKDVEKKP